MNPLPFVSAGGSIPAICQGATTIVLGGSFFGNATSAVWSDGGAGGTFINNTGSTPGTARYTASISAPVNVTLTLTSGGGSCGPQTASKTITIYPRPNVGSNVSPSATVCAGTPVTLSGTGATIYSWTGGVVNGVPFIPVSSNTYLVTGTNSSTGCVNTATRVITVNPLPSVGHIVNPSSGIVCAGSTVILSGTGANSYTGLAE